MTFSENNKAFPEWNNIKVIVFDFDGIFTDNKLYLSEKGDEYIMCNRGDGLGFDILRKFALIKNWNPELLILSKEKNNAALARSKKLKIECINNISDKVDFLEKRFNHLLSPDKKIIRNMVYCGNDLNDLNPILKSQYSFSPCDAHEIIKNNSDYILPRKGGEQFVRMFIEKIIGLEKMSLNEIKKII